MRLLEAAKAIVLFVVATILYMLLENIVREIGVEWARGLLLAVYAAAGVGLIAYLVSIALSYWQEAVKRRE